MVFLAHICARARARTHTHTHTHKKLPPEKKGLAPELFLVLSTPDKRHAVNPDRKGLVDPVVCLHDLSPRLMNIVL
jgi:hypothetical protein